MKFRKKPVVIDAVHYKGDNIEEIQLFTGQMCPSFGGGGIQIDTLEGPITASVDDWIIRGVAGEMYPCKPDIFEATYQEIGTIQYDNPVQGETTRVEHGT